MKICYSCKQSKLENEFTKARHHKDGLQSNCKACIAIRSLRRYAIKKDELLAACKEWKKKNPDRVKEIKRKSDIRNSEQIKDSKLKNKFGINIDYYGLLAKQNNVCALCLNPETTTYKGKFRRMAVDHDHKTGKIRGLLCLRCNVELGIFEGITGDLKRLNAIHKYLNPS